MLPKFHLKQQIIYRDGDSQTMNIITGCKKSGDIWIYETKGEDVTGTNYVHENEIVAYLKNGKWVVA
jgi:hypothetical protein